MRCLTFLLVITLFGCSTTQKTAGSTDHLDITFFKIGKADSILLTIADKTVLIDTGEDEDGEEILEYLDDHNIETIDYMILTHFDKDHVGGADTILNQAEVKQVITPNYESDSTDYKEYIAALNKNQLTPTILTKDLSIQVGSAEFTVYPALKNEYKKDNDYSLMTSVQHGANSFLFAGDAEKKRLTEFMQQGNLEHTLLKVPHHGRYNSKSAKFFALVKPKFAVITSSDKNPEEGEVMNVLEGLGTDVYLTRNGNIHVLSDGKNISLEQ